MEAPLKLNITVTVTDKNGVKVINDSFERNNMSEAALVTMQGGMGQAFAALQSAAEAKVAGK